MQVRQITGEQALNRPRIVRSYPTCMYKPILQLQFKVLQLFFLTCGACCVLPQIGLRFVGVAIWAGDNAPPPMTSFPFHTHNLKPALRAASFKEIYLCYTSWWKRQREGAVRPNFVTNETLAVLPCYLNQYLSTLGARHT